jgi:hypothetical protein
MSPPFLISALGGDEWPASRRCWLTPGEKTPGTCWMGGWLDAVEKRKIMHCRGLNPGRPVRSPSLYRLSYPDSSYSKANTNLSGRKRGNTHSFYIRRNFCFKFESGPGYSTAYRLLWFLLEFHYSSLKQSPITQSVLWLGRRIPVRFPGKEEVFIFTTAYRPVLRFTQPPVL